MYITLYKMLRTAVQTVVLLTAQLTHLRGYTAIEFTHVACCVTAAMDVKGRAGCIWLYMASEQELRALQMSSQMLL